MNLLQHRSHSTEAVSVPAPTKRTGSTGLLFCMIALLLCLLLTIPPMLRVASIDPLLPPLLNNALTLVGGWLPTNLGFSTDKFTAEMLTHNLLYIVLIGCEFLVYGLAVWLLQRQAPNSAQQGKQRIILLGAIIGGVVLLFTPALFSHDMYSYTAYGRLLVVYHVNPYFVAPSAFPHDPFYLLNDWKNATTAYGPIWMYLSTLVTLLAGDSITRYILLYRALEFVAYLLNILLVRKILCAQQATPRTISTGMLLYAWNPLIMQESCLQGHNDTWMITFMLLGLLFLVKNVSTTSAPNDGGNTMVPGAHLGATPTADAMNTSGSTIVPTTVSRAYLGATPTADAMNDGPYEGAQAREVGEGGKGRTVYGRGGMLRVGMQGWLGLALPLLCLTASVLVKAASAPVLLFCFVLLARRSFQISQSRGRGSSEFVSRSEASTLPTRLSLWTLLRWFRRGALSGRDKRLVIRSAEGCGGRAGEHSGREGEHSGREEEHSGRARGYHGRDKSGPYFLGDKSLGFFLYSVWERRFVAIGSAGLSCVVLVLVLYGPFWVGHDLGAIVRSVQSVAVANEAFGSIYTAIHHSIEVYGLPAVPWQAAIVSTLDHLQFWQRINLFTFILFFVGGCVCLWWRPTVQMLIQVTLVLFGAVLLLTTWFLPWYVTWMVALAVISIGWSRQRLMRALIGFTLAFSASSHMIYFFFNIRPRMRDWLGWNFLTTIGPPLLLFSVLLAVPIFSAIRNTQKTKRVLKRGEM